MVVVVVVVVVVMVVVGMVAAVAAMVDVVVGGGGWVGGWAGGGWVADGCVGRRSIRPGTCAETCVARCCHVRPKFTGSTTTQRACAWPMVSQQRCPYASQWSASQDGPSASTAQAWRWGTRWRFKCGVVDDHLSSVGSTQGWLCVSTVRPPFSRSPSAQPRLSLSTLREDVTSSWCGSSNAYMLRGRRKTRGVSAAGWSLTPVGCDTACKRAPSLSGCHTSL